MADFVFNIAKGRVCEFYNRVKTNDPANSALIIVVLATLSLESDAALKILDTLTQLVAGSTNEVTNSGYARTVLTDTTGGVGNTGLSPFTFAPDDSTNVFDIDTPDITWTSVVAGDGWSKFVVLYDNDTTSGTDANIIPLTCHDFVVVPDGTSITAQINSAGFFRAA